MRCGRGLRRGAWSRCRTAPRPPALAVPPKHLHLVGVPGRLEPGDGHSGAFAQERVAAPCLVHRDTAAARLVECLDARPHGIAGRHG